MVTYCEYCNTHPEDSINRIYHDTQDYFPLDDDNAFFERLVLEINQAGLSLITILKKADSFRRAYAGFDIETIASYRESDRARPLADAGIIRNRLKVDAAIENARRIQAMRRQYGSFKSWLDTSHPQALVNWTKLFKKEFTFTGGEIVNEFLMSTSYLPGAHAVECPIHAKVVAQKPAWLHG